MLHCAHIFDRRKTARHSHILLQTVHHLFGHLQIMRIFGGPIEEIGAFDELGPKGMLGPMDLKMGINGIFGGYFEDYLKVVGECVRQEFVLLRMWIYSIEYLIY